MNAELPPFKKEKHNSESASIVDRGLTPLNYSESSFMWMALITKSTEACFQDGAYDAYDGAYGNYLTSR